MKKRLLILIIAVIAVITCACSSAVQKAEEYVTGNAARQEAGFGYETAAMDMAAPEAAPAAEMPMAQPQAAAGEAGNSLGASPLEQHKIIRNASINVETEDFDANLARIEARIASVGGYIEHSTLSGKKPEDWEMNGRMVYLVARVPQGQFEALIKDVEGSGKVTMLERGSSDVTLEYFDNESRLSTLKIQLARLEDILTKSEKLADVLALETEIARVRYEIEALTTTQRRYDDLVQYSTLYVTMHEVKNVTYAPPSDDLGSQISNSFVSAINGLVSFLEDALVFIVGALPVLVLLGVVLLVVYLIIRANKRRQTALAKGEKKLNEQNGDNKKD